MAFLHVLRGLSAGPKILHSRLNGAALTQEQNLQVLGKSSPKNISTDLDVYSLSPPTAEELLQTAVKTVEAHGLMLLKGSGYQTQLDLSGKDPPTAGDIIETAGF